MNKPRVCIVGAGIGGLCAAIQLKKKIGIEGLTIFDRQSDVGGVWMANTYPGCTSEAPINIYGFSFDRTGTHVMYPSQKEMQEYYHRIATKYGLYAHLQFETTVIVERWEDNLSKWRVTYKVKGHGKEREEFFDIVINAVGHLRVPNKPKSFKSFNGPIMHSAEWNPNVEIENKVVGVVGNGASAVQIIPAIQPKVKELHVFTRNPPWMLPRFESVEIPPCIRGYLLSCLNWLFMIYVYFLCEILFYLQHHFLWARNFVETVLTAVMRLMITPELRSALIPKSPFGCARPPVTTRFYKILDQPNVKIHVGRIKSVENNTILTAHGHVQRLDVLILATGFNTHSFAPMVIIGRGGKNITEDWKLNNHSAYSTVITYEAPNMFVVGGPNSIVNHYVAVTMLELQVEFVVKILKEMLNRKATVVSVTKSAEEEFMRKFEIAMSKHVVSTEECTNYKNDGKTIRPRTIWAYSITNFWWRTRRVNSTHFRFESNKYI